MRRLAILTVGVLGAVFAAGACAEAYGVGHAIGASVRCASEDSPSCIRVDLDTSGPGDRVSIQVNGPDDGVGPRNLILIVIG